MEIAALVQFLEGRVEQIIDVPTPRTILLPQQHIPVPRTHHRPHSTHVRAASPKTDFRVNVTLHEQIPE